MRHLIADFRHAWRLYAETPYSTLLALGSLAVALACLTALLSLISDMLKPHPGFEQSGELVTIEATDGSRISSLSRLAVQRLREEGAPVFESVAGVGSYSLELTPGQEALTRIGWVTRGFFDGMRPLIYIGRGFTPVEHEEDAEPVAVISYRYWLDEFGGRADALGQIVTITGIRSMSRKTVSVDYRIVGVMSPSLASVFSSETALWLPFEQARPMFMDELPPAVAAGLPQLYGLARLREGVSFAAARAFIRQLDAERFVRPGFQLVVHPGVVRNINVQRDAERQLRLLLAGGFLLALVAVSNMSLFVLSRASGRLREFGIRMAVGASVSRLARQAVTEAVFLVFTSAGLGIILSLWIRAWVQGLPIMRRAQLQNPSLDWHVLALLGAITLLLAALISIAPVAAAKRAGSFESSRRVTARAGITQRIANTCQIALASALAGAAVAFIWHFTLLHVNRSYDPKNIYEVSVGAWPSDNVLVERARRRNAILSLPAVDAVAFGNAAPARARSPNFFSVVNPSTGKTTQIGIVEIDYAYPRLLGMQLRRGRLPEDGEASVVLVNETLANEFWGSLGVVGEPLELPNYPAEMTVIGVLDDVSFRHPSAEVRPIAFVVGVVSASLYDLFLIRSDASPALLHEELDQLFDDGLLEVPSFDVRALEDLEKSLLAPDRARTALAVASALVIVLLSVLGFYNTQHHVVMSGRREYAIRASLGAGPRALRRHVIARGLGLGAIGLALGAALAFIVVAWLQGGYVSRAVSPLAVAIGVAVGVGLLLITACIRPARYAQRASIGKVLNES